MVEFKNWMDQYGLTRAVINVQVLHDDSKSVLNLLLETYLGLD